MTYQKVSFHFIKRFLLFLDLLFLFVCIKFAYWYRIGEHPSLIEEYGLFAMLGFSLVSLYYLFGSYNYNVSKYNLRDMLKQLLAVIIVLVIMVFYVYMTRASIEGMFGRGVLLGGFSLFYLSSSFYRWLIHLWVDETVSKQRWLVVLSNEYLPAFLEELANYKPKESYFYLTSEDCDFEVVKSLGKRHIGSFSELGSVTENGNWSGVLVGVTDKDLGAINQNLMRIRFEGGQVLSLTDFYELKWKKIPVYFLSKTWFVFSSGFTLVNDPIGLRLKRFCDIIGASLLGVCSLPLLLVSALAIKIEDGGPIFYKQVRVGRNSKPFSIYKLRSMRVDAEKNGAQWAEQNDSRITFVGKILRLTRIDEIPQVINVFLGDMSFVGPRPERPEFVEMLEKEIDHYSLRSLIKPGITGLAQVEYRYGASTNDTKEKLQYDLYYVKNHSMLLDMRIVFRTFKTVLKAMGR
ncbi:MAG: exopolysaccharide biosynthesis polyprenyl glycosylphosphotransferase [Bdellovibrionaceae bacterium]|nr:exopolysaccharide biosynthesis polyprenyl glycosylphosphotransferase [Pseudobdellovibrionaceae bacterium]